MTAIRAIFDGKTFIPQQPVALPADSEAIVIVESADPAAAQRLNDEIRAYYQQGPDPDDEDWARVAEADSSRAWDEE